MKNKSTMNALTVIVLLTAATMFLSACQKNDSVPPASTQMTSELNSQERNGPDVPSILEVPSGNKVCFHAFASGVQIYVVTLTSTGYAWVFQAPEANLYAKPD